MKRILRILPVAVFCSLALHSCTKKDPPADPVGNGTVKLEFANKVGTSNLVVDDQWYLNPHGDSFVVHRLSYFISNIKLNGAKGTYTETESYHLLVQGTPESMTFDMKDVPYGQYSSITLMIGVDSLRNVSGAQTGALDPSSGMFWDWNTGYVMMKLEGTSPKAPTFGGGIVFHAGGYGGANATQRTVTLNLPTAITVGKDGVNHIHLDADILELFKSPTLVDFSTLHTVNMPGTDAKNFADNYANMFTISAAGL